MAFAYVVIRIFLESLKQSKNICVNPYKQCFKHIDNPNSIVWNDVKLCSQVEIENWNLDFYDLFIFRASLRTHQPLWNIQLYYLKLFLGDKVTSDYSTLRLYNPESSWFF